MTHPLDRAALEKAFAVYEDAFPLMREARRRSFENALLAYLQAAQAEAPTDDSDDGCPFCGRDPFHRVHNGIGMEAVAIICCDLGVEYYRREKSDTVTMSREDFDKIADAMFERRRFDRPACRESYWTAIRLHGDAEVQAGRLSIETLKAASKSMHEAGSANGG